METSSRALLSEVSNRCRRGPNWCHLDAPVSLGGMWESQAGGSGTLPPKATCQSCLPGGGLSRELWPSWAASFFARME